MFEEAISLLSIWASMNSWLTPTVLFLLLNLMIGTIAITSGFTSYKPHHQHHHDTTIHHHHHHHHHQPPQLTRAPSVIQRLKSINFYSYYSHTPPTTTTTNHVSVQQTPLQKQHNYYSPPASDLPVMKPEPEEAAVSLQPPRFQVHDHAALPEEDVVNDDGEGPTLDEIYSRIKGTSALPHYDRQNSDTKPAGGEIPVRLPAKMKKSASDKSAFNHFQAVDEAENVVAATAPKAAKAVVGGDAEVDAKADDFINRFKQQLKLQKMDSIVRYKEMITRGSGK